MTQLGFLARSGPSSLGLAMAERYPDSLFVLTTRSSEDRWLESLRALNLRNGPTEAFRTAYGCYEVANHEDQLHGLYRDHNEAVR